MNTWNSQFSPPTVTGAVPELSGKEQQCLKRSATSSNEALPPDKMPRCEPSTSNSKSASTSQDKTHGTGRQNKASKSFSGLSVATANSPELQNPNLVSCDSTPATSITERSADLSYPVINHDKMMSMLADAFTDTDATNAERLILNYGAYYLSSCTCSYTIDGNKTYPDITPFALACRAGNLDIVRRLYVDPKQLNQTFECIDGTNGRTALMLAVMFGRIKVVEQLLRWEADPQIRDEAGDGVDEINFAFNHNKRPVFVEIDKLLIRYREEHNLPQSNLNGYRIGITPEINDWSSNRLFLLVPDGSNCPIQ